MDTDKNLCTLMNECVNDKSKSSLNSAVRADRLQIGVLGCVNAGKSTIINSLANQKVSIVSDIRGTTTDPVYKAMELIPVGPVTFIDTAGLDDDSSLGLARMNTTYDEINNLDFAVVVKDATKNSDTFKLCQLIIHLQNKNIPFLLVFNKCETLTEEEKNQQLRSISSQMALLKKADADITYWKSLALFISAQEINQIELLKEALISKLTELVQSKSKRSILGDLVEENQVIILVTPIDSSAPKGRLILPQVQTIRDILDHKGIALVVQTNQLMETLKVLSSPPALVVTDSQDFHKVANLVGDLPLTSFSILFARLKADILPMIEAAKKIETLTDNSKILIAEGCTHHRQCDDIGTVKLPRWIEAHCKKKFEFHFTQGKNFPQNLHEYDLVVHCGGCMLVDKQVAYRQEMARSCEVPFTNYGILIAYLNGILDRATKPILP